jgi:hypothetical protein
LTEWLAKNSPEQPMLVTLTLADDLKWEKVLLDPNAWTPRA